MRNIDIFATFALISSITGIVTAIVGLVNVFVKDAKKSIFITLIVLPLIVVFSKSIIVMTNDLLEKVLSIGGTATLALSILFISLSFCYTDLETNEKREILKHISFSFFVAVSPIFAFLFNISTDSIKSFLGDTTAYINYLSESKINIEIFIYMFDNLKLTAYYILKSIELIVLMSFAAKGLHNILQLLDKHMPTYQQKSYLSCSTVIVGLAFLLLSSTNVIVLILNGIASQF